MKSNIKLTKAQAERVLSMLRLGEREWRTITNKLLGRKLEALGLVKLVLKDSPESKWRVDNWPIETKNIARVERVVIKNCKDNGVYVSKLSDVYVGQFNMAFKVDYRVVRMNPKSKEYWVKMTVAEVKLAGHGCSSGADERFFTTKNKMIEGYKKFFRAERRRLLFSDRKLYKAEKALGLA